MLLLLYNTSDTCTSTAAEQASKPRSNNSMGTNSTLKCPVLPTKLPGSCNKHLPYTTWGALEGLEQCPLLNRGTFSTESSYNIETESCVLLVHAFVCK
jgi:hypothetical protein